MNAHPVKGQQPHRVALALVPMLALLFLCAGPALAGNGSGKRWTKRSLNKALGQGPYDADGEAVGWNLAGRTFGICTWKCEDRMSEHERLCLLGSAAAGGPVELSVVSRSRWLAAGLRRLTTTENTRFGSCELSTDSNYNENDITCSWSAEVAAAGRTWSVTSSSGECLADSPPTVYSSPDGRMTALVARYAGDHGCGEIEGSVLATPDNLQQLVGGAASCEARPSAGRMATGSLPPVTSWAELMARHSDGNAATARVRIVEFSDFQCPFCSRVSPTVEKLREQYGDQVEVVYLHNALPFHKRARYAAIASVAAAAQGRFWELHDVLFANQRALSEKDIERYAAGAGLEMARFRSDVKSDWAARFADRSRNVSNAVGASGTPAFFLNGRVLKGAQPFERFAEVVDEEIAASVRAGRRGRAWVDSRIKHHNTDLRAYLRGDREPAEVARQKPKPRVVDKTVWKVPVRPDDPMRGRADALVTLVVFSEFQCPFCKRLDPTLEALRADYKASELRIVFKNNPLPFHERADEAAQAALCAHDQGRYSQMHEQLYANQRALEDQDLESYARRSGVSIRPWRKCMQSGRHVDRIAADVELAAAVTARGTPNTYVNGRKLAGAKPKEEFHAIIKEELEKARQLVASGAARANVYDRITGAGKVFKPLEDTVNSFDVSGSPRLGPETADVQVTVAYDYQCPFCARVMPVMSALRSHYQNRLSVVFKQFPLAFHKQAMMAANAALCAQGQGTFEPMHDALFADQQNLSREFVDQAARRLGLDARQFGKCMDRGTYQATIDRDMAEARTANVRGTPTIFLNGRRFVSPSGYNTEAFIKTIDKLLAAPRRQRGAGTPAGAVSGRWAGKGCQKGGTCWTIALDLRAAAGGGVGGTVTYPSLDCSAQLEFVRWDDATAVFRERFESPGRCVPDGWLSLGPVGANELSFVWAWPDGRVDSKTTVRRTAQ